MSVLTKLPYKRIISYLLPLTIEQSFSSLNGQIKVILSDGQYKISAGEAIQSGGQALYLWQQTFSSLKDHEFRLRPPATCLFLGLAGGNAVTLAHTYWPKARLLAVDYDPVIVGLGRKYFTFSDLGSLQIIIADARHWVSRSHRLFDCLFVDLYHGADIPAFALQKSFLTDLKKRLTPHGVIVFNYSIYQRGNQEIKQFKTALHSIFPFCRHLSLPYNHVYLLGRG